MSSEGRARDVPRNVRGMSREMCEGCPEEDARDAQGIRTVRTSEDGDDSVGDDTQDVVEPGAERWSEEAEKGLAAA